MDAGVAAELEHDDERYDPWVEYDDPEYGEHLRWRSLTAEQQVDELNRCEAVHETPFYWRVEGGEPVREVEPLCRREYDQRQAWRRALAVRRGRLARFVRPLVRVRDHGRARRGRRAAFRCSPARSPGRPERPSRPLERTAAA